MTASVQVDAIRSPHLAHQTILERFRARFLIYTAILGNRKGEGRAFAELAFHFDRAAVDFDDFFDERKPQAGAGDFAHFFIVRDTIKFFKDARQRFFGNAEAVVFDLTNHKILVLLQPQFDGCVLRAVFYGVAKEIEHDLLQKIAVAKHERNVVRDLYADHDAFAFGLRHVYVEHFV